MTRPAQLTGLFFSILILLLSPVSRSLAQSADTVPQPNSEQPSEVAGSPMKMIMPFMEGDYFVSQHFGEIYRSSLVHLGVDYAVFSYRSEGDKRQDVWGTPIYPVADGEVVATRCCELSNRADRVGNYLMIQHRNGVVSAYLHLARVFVEVGDKVRENSIIAEAGDLGLHNRDSDPPSSPHLHLEIRTNGATTLSVPPNRRIAYVSADGTTKLDSDKLPEGGVPAWIAESFLDPGIELRARLSREITLSGFQTRDGEKFDLVPFARYSGRSFSAVSQDIENDLGIDFGPGEFLPSGGFNSESPLVAKAKSRSLHQPGDWFRVYKSGNIVGYFRVDGLDLSFEGGLKVVGVGVPIGFDLTLDNYYQLLAVPWIPPKQTGFRRPTGIPSELHTSIVQRAIDLLPSHLPVRKEIATLVGPRIRVRSARLRDQGTVLDLDRDDQPELVSVVTIQLEPANANLWATVFHIVETGDQEGTLGKTLLSSVVIVKDDFEKIYGAGSYDLVDVLDVTGNGTAELFLSEGFYEAANMKIFQYANGELQEVSTTLSYIGH